MRTGMKNGKKAMGIGLGILLGLSPLQTYAAEAEGVASVSGVEDTESGERISPTAESIMRNFMESEAEKGEIAEGGDAAGLADDVPVEVADGEEVEISEANFPDEEFRSKVYLDYDGYEANQYGVLTRDGKLSANEIARIESINIDMEPTDLQLQYQDVTGIEHFTALTYFNCRWNKLMNLNVSKNTALTYLNCTANQLANLDVSQNTMLTQLECGANSLGSLDISQNTELEYLFCPGNQLTGLDTSQNMKMTDLWCSKNQLTSLDVSQNTMLTDLRCYSNQLTSLDVSQNAMLTDLRCYSNHLINLDISQNTMLTDLWCSSNQLTSLDVSRNTELAVLECSSNRLTNLDVSRNTALVGLSCGSNQLTSLDVSRNTGLTALECANNRLSCLDLSNTDLEADDAVIDIGNQTIEIDGSQIDIFAYDSHFDISRVGEIKGLVLKDGVFTLADGVKSGSYVYNVKLPSGNSIPMEVTIKTTGNSGDGGDSGSDEGDDGSGNDADEGSSGGSSSGVGNSGNGSFDSGSGDDGDSQEENGGEIAVRTFQDAMWWKTASVRGRRVKTSEGNYITSTIDGTYDAKSIKNMAVVTPKESVAEAAGIPADELKNGTDIRLQVRDSDNKKMNQTLKSIADGMGKKVMAYIDVDLLSENNNRKQDKVKFISTTSEPITMVFGVPDAYVNSGHSYSVVCMDKNGNPVIFPDTDTDDKTITINADVIGTYMIVY